MAVVEYYLSSHHWPENTEGNYNNLQRTWPRFEPGPSRCAFRRVSPDYDCEFVILPVSNYAYCVLLWNKIDTKAAPWIFFKNLPRKTAKRKVLFINFSVGEQFRRLASLRRSIIRHLKLTELIASHAEIVSCSTYIFLSRSSLLLIDLGSLKCNCGCSEGKADFNIFWRPSLFDSN